MPVHTYASSHLRHSLLCQFALMKYALVQLSPSLEVKNELKGEKSTLGDETNLSTTSQIALPEEEQSFQTLPTIDLTKLANWPDQITDNLRVTLVINGPSAPNPSFVFHVNAKNRRFNPSCAQKVLKMVKRSWLIYSKRKDVVFCFSCKLFGDMNTHLKTIGFGDWKNLHRQLNEHETSKNHICLLNKWMELANRLDTNKTIDASQHQLLSAELQRWQLVLERLFAIVTFLGEQCLAFRGNSDVLHEKSSGNFLKLVKLLAQFDVVMADDVHRTKNEEIITHYLVKNIQNELIQIIAKRIRAEILSKFKMAKYFSIIVDCTQDVSKVEQMSIVLRMVQMKIAEVKVCEHFIDFIPVEQTTGSTHRCYSTNADSNWDSN
ncbi:zinc finger MYM-type protein 1-like [Hydra vulgaris]|uniref:Zinc finger MYM-type protein 1-like n=1 Tax=Hydra vulgaris TaxID=6087 RepID=A0ABM4D140_HYDVU